LIENKQRYQCRRPGLWFIDDNGRGVDIQSKVKYVGAKNEKNVVVFLVARMDGHVGVLFDSSL
jgi:hypothetical protein